MQLTNKQKLFIASVIISVVAIIVLSTTMSTTTSSSSPSPAPTPSPSPAPTPSPSPVPAAVSVPKLVSGPLVVGSTYIMTTNSNGTELALLGVPGTGITRTKIDLTQSNASIRSSVSANALWKWDGVNLVAGASSLGLTPVNVADTRYRLSFGAGTTCLIFSGNGTNTYTSLFSWGSAGSCGLGSDANFLANKQGVFQFYLVQ